MNEYKLTFSVTIKDRDDPAARMQVKAIVEALGGGIKGADVKLQQVHQDKPPRGIRMD